MAKVAAEFVLNLRELEKLRKNSRLERAKLFTRLVLKKKRKGKKPWAVWLEDASDEELEELYENIAAELEGSPHFGELVDTMSQDAKQAEQKITAS